MFLSLHLDLGPKETPVTSCSHGDSLTASSHRVTALGSAPRGYISSFLVLVSKTCKCLPSTQPVRRGPTRHGSPVRGTSQFCLGEHSTGQQLSPWSSVPGQELFVEWPDSTAQPGMVTHTISPSTHRAEAGRSLPGLFSESVSINKPAPPEAEGEGNSSYQHGNWPAQSDVQIEAHLLQ